MLCPFCQSENPSPTQFCRTCGAELRAFAMPSGASRETSSDALLTGTLLAGTYSVESVLGQGGFGITYKCHDKMLDRRVAIKEFFPSGCRRENALVQPSRGLSDSDFGEARAQFLAEARLLARCHHPGIVGVYTAFEANQTAYMVMELLHGQSLAQRLDARGGRLSEEEAVPLIERTGQALQFVHDLGLLHRDIKPENIIVCDDGRVMLIDFGTAREYVKGQAQGHTIVVTPGYAPLEQYARQAQRGAFTDVYGLCATLYHLLTGKQPPAASDRAMGVLLRPVREENPQISQGVARAVEAGLQMEIAKRPASVREFLELMHAPEPLPSGVLSSPNQNAVAQAEQPEEESFEEFLAPNPIALAPAEKSDDFKASNLLPLDFHSGALQARQQMLASVFPESQPVQLAPQPLLPGATTSGAPPVPSHNGVGGGVLTKNTSSSSSSQSAGSTVGIILLFALGLWGLGRWMSSSQRTERWATSVSSGSQPNFPPSSYQPSVSSPRPLIERNPAEEAARKEMESTPILLSSSVEILPRSIKTPENLNLPLSYALMRGLAELSPNGQLVSYMDGRDRVRVWSLAKHKVVRSLPQSKSHPAVRALFSRDGENVVLTYQNQSGYRPTDQISVWNLRTGKSQGTLSIDPTKEWLWPQEVLSNGQVLVLTSPHSHPTDPRNSLFLWDPRTGKRSAVPVKKGADLHNVVVSPDGQQIVTGDDKGNIRWLDAKTGAQKAERSTSLTYRDIQALPSFDSRSYDGTTLDHPLYVDLLRFSNNGSWLASRNEGQIRVFDSKAQEVGSLSNDFLPSFSLSSALAVSPDGKFVAQESGKEAGFERIMLWNVRQRKKVRLRSPLGEVNKLAFSADGKQVIGVSSANGRIALTTWQIGAKPIAPFSKPQVTASMPTRSSEGGALSAKSRLFATQTPNSIEINRLDGTRLKTLDLKNLHLNEMKFSPDGRLLAGGHHQEGTRIWNVQTGQMVARLDPVEQPNRASSGIYGGERVVFSSDSRLLARAKTIDKKNNLVEVWSLGKTPPRRLASLNLSQPVTQLAFSPDNRSLVCGGEGGALQWYDVANQKLKAEINNPAPVTVIVATTQGLAVVRESRLDATVTFYEAQPSRKPAHSSPSQKSSSFLKQKTQVSLIKRSSYWDKVAISPDGQLLANIEEMNPGINPPRSEVAVWDLRTGFLLQRLFMPSTDGAFGDFSRVDNLAFSPDGTRIIATNIIMNRDEKQIIEWQRPPIEKQPR